ncbi:NAD-dependent dehydratase [Pseudomonas tohonis]|uniref:NAD-dependent dehydratase n=1 Tax=Pseudomonas tohonis TaxID=2725477 RepID=A0A6J4ED34_9PSED|nr:TIGR01777 family oxidoreductase [Pseudomonas tohonis]BCG26944.1 NAD-dependent dehydratase [Pseudomonas tohonis]GJN50320.1 NAD-dependent dehydratase [Pseudomonas tohonis]
MHILLTGGTGLIGRELCRLWSGRGHQVTVLSRTPQRVAGLCGPAVRAIGSVHDYGDGPLDALVNMAGEPVAGGLWTRARKAKILDSRVAFTERLLAWLETREQRPALLLSGSAVGWYGDAGEREVREDSAPGNGDFASALCIAWEETAQRAEALGIRVVLLRTGLVLAERDGFLRDMLRPFRLGLGGRLGSGRQWMPWIHLQDQIAAMDFLLHQEGASGPYNACAPHPARNRDFTRSLGRALGRPAFLPAPAFALRLLLGEMSILLLGGQRALPTRLLEAGFTFRFTDLDTALADVLRPKDVA